MFLTKMLPAALLLFALPQWVWAHGTPIVLSGDNEQLLATPKVITSEFERLAPTLLTTDLPGFGIVSDESGVPVGVDVQLQIISKLWYWNPALGVPDDTESVLTLENKLGDGLEVDRHTTKLGPLQVAAYDGVDGWHRHVDYFLDPADSPAGAYGIVFEVLAEPLVKTEPVLVVFGNYGENFGADDLPGAVDDLLQAIFAIPGDANRDGRVDLADFGVLKENFGLMPATWEQGNFDDEPSVSLSDFGVLKENFGKTSNLAAAVPEPSSWAIALAGLTGLAVRWATGKRR